MARSRVKAPPSGPPIDGSTIGELLQWDGQQWVPVAGGASASDILTWNGSAWAPGAPAAVPADLKLWEWNGVDVSQFEGSAGAQRLYDASTLTVVADTTLPKGRKLRLTAAGGAGGGEVSWLANQALAFTGNERNYRMRIEVVGLTEEYAGPLFLAQKDGSGDLYGFSDVSGTATAAGWRNRWDAGTNVDSGATQRGMHASAAGPVTLGVITLYDFHVRGSKADGAAPDFFVTGNSQTDNNAATAGRKAWALADALTSGWSAFPAAWNSLNDLNRFGLSIKANTGFPVYDIHALEIWTDGFTSVGL